ncbi:hypothetical protein [Actinoallomurus acaciae]|uniref:Uncharacterized protein n=1 Tax=Actinoallomurus acaciae TaxID=502577 RepID=A0ABV5Y718_9ACTN
MPNPYSVLCPLVALGRVYAGAVLKVHDVLVSSEEQAAVRLLMLLHVAADSVLAEPAPDEAEACIAGEMRLQAMDCWLRNPDYLAWELLDQAELRPDAVLVGEAARIVSAEEEPDLRTTPMLRWRHGAWERLDDCLSLLAVDIRRGKNLGGRRDFYLLAEGRRAATRLLADIPALGWYADRAHLVGVVAGDVGGDELKARQKAVWEYRDTRWNDHIAGIRVKVMERLSRLGQGVA